MLLNRQEENGDVEGLSIVFPEAHKASKPVIGSRSGGAFEAIIDEVSGFLANPEDYEELAEILRRVPREFDWKTRAQMPRKSTAAS